MTPYETIEQFLLERRDMEQIKPKTILSYRHTLGKLVEWAGDRPLQQLSVRDLQEFITRPRRAGGGETRPPAEATVRRETTTVRAFYEYLMAMDDVPLPSLTVRHLGMWKSGAVQISAPKPVDDETFLTLWHGKHPQPDKVWFGLGYFLGFRVHEWVMVTPAQFDLNQGMVHFARKGQWGTTHDLKYMEMINIDLRPHLPQHLVDAMDEWLVELNSLVKEREGKKYLMMWTDTERVESGVGRFVDVPTGYDTTRYNRRLVWAMNRVGLSPSKATPHRLRHSAATNLYRAGTPLLRIATLMHHSSLEMTRRYADVSSDYTEYRRRHLHGDAVDE